MSTAWRVDVLDASAHAIQVRVGVVIRDERRQRRWSQEALAESADLNRSYVGEIERGEVIPSIITLEKLASALGVRLSMLLARCES